MSERGTENQFRRLEHTKPSRITAWAKKSWLAIVLVLLAVIFIAQNRAGIQIRLLWLTVESPLWLILAILFVVGMVSGIVIGRRRRRAAPKVEQPD